MTKYRNEKATAFGITFDSIAERDRYFVLKSYEDQGTIKHLMLQPKFCVVPAHKTPAGKKEREVTYSADFMYIMDDLCIIEDVKGVSPRSYINKRKLLTYLLSNGQLPLISKTHIDYGFFPIRFYEIKSGQPKEI